MCVCKTLCSQLHVYTCPYKKPKLQRGITLTKLTYLFENLVSHKKLIKFNSPRSNREISCRQKKCHKYQTNDTNATCPSNFFSYGLNRVCCLLSCFIKSALVLFYVFTVYLFFFLSIVCILRIIYTYIM